MKKTYHNAFIALLLTFVMVFAGVVPVGANTGEENGYQSVADYIIPETIAGVVTSTEYPWAKQDDGSIKSTNSCQASTMSVLKVTVRGSGSLNFMYKVSSYSANSLLFSKDDRFLEAAKTGYSALYESKIEYERFKGEIGWTGYSIPIEADETAETSVYFAYKTGAKQGSGDDCAWLKNLSFSNGTIQVQILVNDQTCGTVTGAGEYTPGDTVSVSANPNAGCRFYGWIMDGELVSGETTYSFLPVENTQITALFGQISSIVAQNIRTGSIYTSVATALSETEKNDTIWLMSNVVIDENIQIPPDVTLYIPYSDVYNEKGYEDGTQNNSPVFATDDMAYRVLTLTRNATLDVQGKLLVGAVIGYPSQQYQGHTSGAFGKIENHGQITVSNHGVLDCWGFITGDGTVCAESGTSVYEPFVVYDFSGGSNTLQLVNANQSPFAQYTMQNIRCRLTIKYGASLFGRCNLYASSAYNKTDALVIGTPEAGGLIQLKEDATLLRMVGTNGLCGSYCPDISRVIYEISGGSIFDSLSMSIMGADVSTKNVLFPIPYTYCFQLKNGIYEINTGTVIMPGAVMEVAPDATLLVNDRFFVLDGLLQGDLSGKSYPSTALLKANGLSAGGVLIVNGKMIVADQVPFGGIIQASKTGAVIQTLLSERPDESAEVDYFDNEIRFGAKTSYGDNTTILWISARVYSGNSLVKLEADKEYRSVDNAGWTLPSYTIEQYAKGGSMLGPTTVDIDQEMQGIFKTSDDSYLKGDINMDGVINSLDATALAKYLAGLKSLDQTQKSIADINKDGVINSFDATRLAKFLAGILSKEEFFS